MKLLFDENLSPSLTRLLQDVFPGSAHVHECGLGSSDDVEVWDYAKANGFVIVSKDSDFQERSLFLGAPPKVVWVRAGNCSTRQIETMLRTHSVLLHNFEGSSDVVLVIS